MRPATLAVVLLAGAVALAQPVPEPPVVDVSKIRASLEVFHDGKGHYFVVRPPKTTISETRDSFFYGDGKTFYRQHAPSGGRNRQSYDVGIYDPRIRTLEDTHFSVDGGKAELRCERRRTALTRLGASETKALLARATLRDIYWVRDTHLLARDRRGVYYFVDALPASNPDRVARPTGFRVFSGPQGKLKALRMRTIVSDSSGEIFVTGSGRLRLIVAADSKRRQATWIAGQRKVELTVVDHEQDATQLMIHRELGVYAGQKLRKPCDDL